MTKTFRELSSSITYTDGDGGTVVVPKDNSYADYVQFQAQQALAAADSITFNYLTAAIAVPADLAAYRTALQAIISNPQPNTALPTAPVLS